MWRWRNWVSLKDYDLRGENENETRNAPYVSVKISNDNVKICANTYGNGGFELDENVVFDRTEGIVSYYRIQN